MANEAYYEKLKLYDKSIDVLKLPGDVAKRLHARDLHKVKDFVQMTCDELIRDNIVNHESLIEVKNRLKQYDVKLVEKRGASRRDNVKTYSYPYNLFEAIKEGRYNIITPDEATSDIQSGVLLAISHLDERTADMLTMRYKEYKTFDEVGNKYGVSGNRARQIIAKGIRSLASMPMLQMIQLGLKGYTESVVEQRLALMLSVAEQGAYNKGYDEGYQAGYDDKKKSYRDIKTAQDIQIEDIGLSIRAFNGLERAGNKTLADILTYSDVAEIKNIRNLGRKTLEEIARKLYDFGCINEAWAKVLEEGIWE